ncbi:MAG: hypothetical protein GXP57_04900 [Deltaproteobacteria bacterium]|nr:hypothetical protein [Deltaproteobacteria bacterium]
MLKPFFDFIEKFATDFTWKRLVILIGLVMLTGAVLFLYEAQTATSQLTKYERAVSIIKEIESLKINNKESTKVVEHIYSGLAKITEPQSSPATFNTNVSPELKQALLAAAPWLLFCLFFIPGYFKGKDDAPSIIGGTLALSFIMGIGGYFIPVEWGSWVGFGVYPFGVNLLIFIMLMWYGNRKSA